MKRTTVVVAAVVAFSVTVSVLLLLGKRGDDQPLVPTEGEKLRLQARGEAPKPRDPAVVEKELTGKAMAPGDRALFDLLTKELAQKATPTFRVATDMPIADNAAPAIRDELDRWIERKMASLGFARAESRPTVAWLVQLDPEAEGRWKVGLRLRAGGETKLERSYTLPAQFSPTRLDALFAPDFAAPENAAR